MHGTGAVDSCILDTSCQVQTTHTFMWFTKQDHELLLLVVTTEAIQWIVTADGLEHLNLLVSSSIPWTNFFTDNLVELRSGKLPSWQNYLCVRV